MLLRGFCPNQSPVAQSVDLQNPPSYWLFLLLCFTLPIVWGTPVSDSHSQYTAYIKMLIAALFWWEPKLRQGLPQTQIRSSSWNGSSQDPIRVLHSGWALVAPPRKLKRCTKQRSTLFTTVLPTGVPAISTYRRNHGNEINTHPRTKYGPLPKAVGTVEACDSCMIPWRGEKKID